MQQILVAVLLAVIPLVSGMSLRHQEAPTGWGALTLRQHAATSLVRPSHIAVDSAGRVYVTDPGADSVVVLSPSGAVLSRFGGKRFGHRLGEFTNPPGIALGPRGEIYVVDSGNSRVQKLSLQGQPLLQWGSAGSRPGQFRTPIGVAVTARGSVYVSDADNSRVQEFSSGRRVRAAWGSKARQLVDSMA
jgi:tripartite motif-containing protein 71